MYDYRCSCCGYEQIDVWEPIYVPKRHHDSFCNGLMERSWLQTHKAPGVISDDIPGGVEITHGLCNSDGTPHRYYSKTEMRREATKRGLTNLVEHKGSKGSNKSPHTQRWY